jgi:hypothetical protein
MTPTPEQGRILLDNLVKVGVLERRAGPSGQECYCFTAHMAPSLDLERMVADGLLEKRTSPSGHLCYCLTAPLAPLDPQERA